ncbi:MAG: hypothetical protein AABM30_03395 [Actinomycetota bacterium]
MPQNAHRTEVPGDDDVERVRRGLRGLLGVEAKPNASTTPESDELPETVGAIADLRKAMESMRELLRRFGAALGAGATALLAGLGYTQVHKIFPLPADSSGWTWALAVASSVGSLVGAAWVAGRFFGAQRRIGIKTEAGRETLRPRERELRDRVFTDTAAEEDAAALRDVELRAIRLNRIAQHSSKAKAKDLQDEAERLQGKVRLACVRAAAEILEWRSQQAFNGVLTKVAVLMTILGIVGIFGVADWSQGQRDLVALRKSCAEATTAGAIDACVTVVPRKDRTSITTSTATTTTASPQASEWLNSYREIKIARPLTVYRVYGGDSARQGRWATPATPANRRAAVAALALPQQNAARCIVRVRIPTGLRIRIGHVAANFGKPGGAGQVEILGTLKSLRFFADRPLPPAKGPCP